MEIYKDLSNPASKEFEQLLNSQFTKNKNLEEGKIITGVVNKVTDNFVFLEVEGLKSEPILDINELKSMGMLDKAKIGEKISVLLERLEDKKGEVLVSASKAQKIEGWDKLVKAYENNEPIMGKITGRDIIEPEKVMAPTATPMDISIRLANLISPRYPRLKAAGFKKAAIATNTAANPTRL